MPVPVWPAEAAVEPVLVAPVPADPVPPCVAELPFDGLPVDWPGPTEPESSVEDAATGPTRTHRLSKQSSPSKHSISSEHPCGRRLEQTPFSQVPVNPCTEQSSSVIHLTPMTHVESRQISSSKQSELMEQGVPLPGTQRPWRHVSSELWQSVSTSQLSNPSTLPLTPDVVAAAAELVVRDGLFCCDVAWVRVADAEAVSLDNEPWPVAALVVPSPLPFEGPVLGSSGKQRLLRHLSSAAQSESSMHGVKRGLSQRLFLQTPSKQSESVVQAMTGGVEVGDPWPLADTLLDCPEDCDVLEAPEGFPFPEPVLPPELAVVWPLEPLPPSSSSSSSSPPSVPGPNDLTHT